MPVTTKEILTIAAEEDVEVRLQFTDILGTTKNVTIMQQLAKALDNKIMFDGSSIKAL